MAKTTPLERELSLLYRCEMQTGLLAAPVVRQLIAWEEARLPDAISRPPMWVEFTWPVDGDVDLRGYWRDLDRHRYHKTPALI